MPKRRKVTKKKLSQSKSKAKKDEGDDSDDMMRIDDCADSDDAPAQSRRLGSGKKNGESKAVVRRSARPNKGKKV